MVESHKKSKLAAQIIEYKFSWVIQHDVMLLVYRRDRLVS